MKCLDKIGQEIVSGSCIAYGHALGRCAGLRIGRVVSTPKQITNVYNRREWRITVVGVSDDWDQEKPKLLSKKSTIQFPKRVIVLDPCNMSNKFYSLLMDLEWDGKHEDSL